MFSPFFSRALHVKQPGNLSITSAMFSALFTASRRKHAVFRVAAQTGPLMEHPHVWKEDGTESSVVPLDSSVLKDE